MNSLWLWLRLWWQTTCMFPVRCSAQRVHNEVPNISFSQQESLPLFLYLLWLFFSIKISFIYSKWLRKSILFIYLCFSLSDGQTSHANFVDAYSTLECALYISSDLQRARSYSGSWLPGKPGPYPCIYWTIMSIFYWFASWKVCQTDIWAQV